MRCIESCRHITAECETFAEFRFLLSAFEAPQCIKIIAVEAGYFPFVVARSPMMENLFCACNATDDARSLTFHMEKYGVEFLGLVPQLEVF